MNKKKIWILTGIIIVLVLLILILWLLNIKKSEPFVAKTYPTANGGTISATDKTSESIALNDDGTSSSDALYEYKSAQGYSVQYNNKYIVDFGTKEYDFKITNSTNTASVVISPMDMQEGIAAIQTKEEWDALMAPMIGTECLEFKRTPINNMEALIAHYSIDFGNGQTSDVIYAMLIGKNKIYNYIYTAFPGASEAEATQIGATLYTITAI